MDPGPSNHLTSNSKVSFNNLASSRLESIDSKPNIQPEEVVPIKKKRKQLVACDACRVRRVKCDKADRQGLSCTECVKKSINCTDTYIKSKPPKAVRNGKLIEKARLLYGDGNSAESPELSPTDFSTVNSSAPKISGNNQIIRAADGRLFNAELAHSIASHLIDTYVELIHPQCPIVDIDHFMNNFRAVGRDTGRMSSTGEALGLVLQAIAARFSDHPSIVGVNAPKIQDLKQHEGKDFSEFGIARESFARAMADRALKVIDENGTLRRPSAASTGALLMLEFLLTWDDSYRSTGRHLLTAAVEHLRSLSDGVTDDPSETKVDQVGNLFWMSFTRDAISSSFGGRSTALSENDLVVLCELLSNPITDQIESFVSSDDIRNLGGLAVIVCFKFITNLVRLFTTHVAGPLPRRAPMNETTIRQLWSGLDESKRHSDIFFDSVQRANWPTKPNSDPWFRDLCSMRVQLAFVIHRNICDRLQAELDATGPRDKAYQAYLETLKALKAESDIRFLIYIRQLGLQIHNYGTNLIFVSVLSCENMSHYVAHLLSTPVWEQGGNDETWTLSNKLEEVNWFLNALKLMSWAWGNYRKPINDASLAIAHLNLQTQHARASIGTNLAPTEFNSPNAFISNSQTYSRISQSESGPFQQQIQPPSLYVSQSPPSFLTGLPSSDYRPTRSNDSSFSGSDSSFQYPQQQMPSHDGWSQPYPSQPMTASSFIYQEFTAAPGQLATSSTQFTTSTQYTYSNNIPSTSSEMPYFSPASTPSTGSPNDFSPHPITSGQYTYNPSLYPRKTTGGTNHAFDSADIGGLNGNGSGS